LTKAKEQSTIFEPVKVVEISPKKLKAKNDVHVLIWTSERWWSFLISVEIDVLPTQSPR